MSSPLQHATFGGGCFWCLDAVFRFVDGVVSITSGYAGGSVESPDYEQVSTGATGHAEVVRVGFDPSKVGFSELLLVFWHSHDPTSLNQQGADVGTQYRSVIFFHDEAQRLAAEESMRRIEPHFSRPIVTEIAPAGAFHPAEASHQDYYRRQPNAPYCQIMIRPKLEKLRAAFSSPA